MPIYNRNADYPGRPPNWWIDYYVDGKRIREPGCGKNERASQRLLDKRKREIEAGTWKPPRVRADDNLTVAEWAERYVAMRSSDAELATSARAGQNVHDQEVRLNLYVLPKLGARPLAAVTREEIKGVITELTREGRLAPRTIHHVYGAMRGMFSAALAAEPALIERNPCSLTVRAAGELPKKRDKRPGWRKEAVFTHGELVRLFTDERNPPDRRVLWASLFFCGARFGEGVGLRWLDYDSEARPLGRIVLTVQYDGLPLKGEGEAREIPVHPFFAWMLDWWRRDGFANVMGRDPKPEDWIVPSRRGRVRSLKHSEHKLEQDLERIGLRRRTPHDLRASFITLAQDDGGERAVLERITHKGNTEVWTGYSRHRWTVLCEHVSRLRLVPPVDEYSRSHFQSHAEGSVMDLPINTEQKRRDGRDLKQPTTSILPRKLRSNRDKALARYAVLRGESDAGSQPVTRGVTVDLVGDLRRVADVIRSGRISELTGDERERLAVAAEAAAGSFEVPEEETASDQAAS